MIAAFKNSGLERKFKKSPFYWMFWAECFFYVDVIFVCVVIFKNWVVAFKLNTSNSFLCFLAPIGLIGVGDT